MQDLSATELVVIFFFLILYFSGTFQATAILKEYLSCYIKLWSSYFD